jgi:hypothetical protein
MHRCDATALRKIPPRPPPSPSPPSNDPKQRPIALGLWNVPPQPTQLVHAPPDRRLVTTRRSTLERWRLVGLRFWPAEEPLALGRRPPGAPGRDLLEIFWKLAPRMANSPPLRSPLCPLLALLASLMFPPGIDSRLSWVCVALALSPVDL